MCVWWVIAAWIKQYVLLSCNRNLSHTFSMSSETNTFAMPYLLYHKSVLIIHKMNKQMKIFQCNALILMYMSSTISGIQTINLCWRKYWFHHPKVSHPYKKFHFNFIHITITIFLFNLRMTWNYYVWYQM